jgi:nicotinamide riboside kinase
MRIKFNKLILSGEDRKYEVNFKDGLNFITGPISTGKSTILELIDYCLGKKNHKDYQEVKLTCKYVSLDLFLNDQRVLIQRPLFSFELPVKIFKWNDETNDFSKEFDFYTITSPLEENSLSRFLNENIGMPEFKLSGQTFSFRDLYKYCYIGQTKIDSEDILNEKVYTLNFKRKPTLEIILNSLNLLLNELKNDEKTLKEKIGILLDKKEAIVKFLRDVELFSTNAESEKNKAGLIYRKNDLFKVLNELKTNGKIENDNTKSKEKELFTNRNLLSKIETDIDEIRKYVTKLNVLRNQYSNEIIKIDYLIISNGKLQNIEFHNCPSCNCEIEKKDYDVCNLCGNDLTEFNDEEEKAIKLERKRLNSKLNSLVDFIENQKETLENLEKRRVKILYSINIIETDINNIQKEFISPYIEKIEALNREIGEVTKQIENLDLSLNVQIQLATLSNDIQKDENKLSDIKKQIKDIEEEETNFDEILKKLSDIFEKTLKAFDFPKLYNAYIDNKSYLPYVRGVKYDNIGSLGAVTLVNIAYFMSILEISLSLKKSYHPKVVLFDTIGKNLGTRESTDNNDEFKDSKIFKSLLKYFDDFSKKYKDKVQIIIVNNDYTSDISDEDIIIKFDGDGSKGISYGLINDIVN